jgi:hypothetical protein
MLQFKLTNPNNTDVKWEFYTLEEVRKDLKGMINLSYETITNDKELLKDDFLNFSLMRFNTIDAMKFNELVEMYYVCFGYKLEKVGA